MDDVDKFLAVANRTALLRVDGPASRSHQLEMIPAYSRAACAMLNWTKPRLAEAAGLGLSQATTFCDILRTRAAKGPHKQAFVFLDLQGAIADELTFAALDRRAHAIATELVINGLSGERALLVFPPGLDFVAALFACFYAAVVAVPVPFLSGKRIVERITSIRRDADPAGVLMLGRPSEDPQLCEASFGVADKLVWIQIDALDPDTREVSLPMPGPDTLALLQYTSGLTSSPKGVMLSQANLIANSGMITEAFGHDETSRGVGWLPLFHDMGLVGHVLQPGLLRGCFSAHVAAFVPAAAGPVATGHLNLESDHERRPDVCVRALLENGPRRAVTGPGSEFLARGILRIGKGACRHPRPLQHAFRGTRVSTAVAAAVLWFGRGNFTRDGGSVRDRP